MASRQRTQLLMLLLIASAIASASAWSVMDGRRGSAIASQQDRASCAAELVNLVGASAQVKSTTLNGVGDDDLTINRRLRGAAVAAHLADQLASIEPGSTVRVHDTDYVQTPIYLRLNAVSLKRLVGFLYELSNEGNALRTTDIELSPPVAMPASPGEPGDLWTADVTLNYLSSQRLQASESR